MTEIELLKLRISDLEKLVYSKISTKRYRVVTAEVKEYTGWWHGNQLIIPYLPIHCDYRIRKVSRGELFPGDSAFIIEKEEA